ncbi:MAG: efflux RND transporter periplasmic adaptor subunit [Pseudomonadota bacterium]
MEAPQRNQAETVLRLHDLQIVRDEEAAPKVKRGSWLLIALLGGLFLGLAVLGWSFAAPSQFTWAPPRAEKTPAPAPNTTAAAARIAPVAAQLTMAGYLVALTSAEISTEVTATVAGLHVSEGDNVEAGQLIAELDGSLAAVTHEIYAARANAAEWSIDVLRKELEEAERSLDRIRTLAQRQISARSALDRAETAVSVLGSRLNAAEAQHQIALLETQRAKLKLAQYRIVAPFSGTVTECSAQVGETVSIGDVEDGGIRGICTIVDFSSIVIEIDVPEPMIHRVQPGTAALAVLDAYPDDRLEAIVQAIAPVANRAKSTIKARLAFTNPLDTRLRPDMAITVRLEE